MSDTFYWHDYETFGTDPSRDRPVQFAGLRTDTELNIIGEPLVLFAKPARDVLPHPAATLVTGITPQRALAEGVAEATFSQRIHAELMQPGTCSVGYNSIRFDEEVTRYTLYRNFLDPYEHAWRNGNSRWDIIDMLRMAHALRPDGIAWPEDEDGRRSFRLELLSKANGIEHESAHDALSDVHATIGLARLVRERQPRLFNYALRMRDKRAVLQMLDLASMSPVLHVSGMFGVERHNIALVSPLMQHPHNQNEIVCFDLAADPAVLADLDADALRERLYTRTEDLPEGAARAGLKSIRVNRAPMVVRPKMLDAATAERLGIDVPQCREHRQQLRAMPGLLEKLHEVYAGDGGDGGAGADSAGASGAGGDSGAGADGAGASGAAGGGVGGASGAARGGNRNHPKFSTNPDRMLYAGFFKDADKQLMEQVRAASPDELREQTFPFEDPRLPELLFRYRARNYPESLTPAEQEQWEEYRYQYLTDPEAEAGITLDEYQRQIEELLARNDLTPAQREVLDALMEYGDSLLA